MAPRILIFSIAMDADNSFYVKSIATYASTFFGYIISVLAMVGNLQDAMVTSKTLHTYMLFIISKYLSNRTLCQISREKICSGNKYTLF